MRFLPFGLNCACCMALIFTSLRYSSKVVAPVGVQEDVVASTGSHLDSTSVHSFFANFTPGIFRRKQQQREDIPILVISSLRPDYLRLVLEAIQPENQNPNTPGWLLDSPCHVFAHKNNNTDIEDRWKGTQIVVQKYGCTMHVFEGNSTEEHRKVPANVIRAYSTKHTWYRMMRYLFHDLKEKEVFILEDDAVLAPDGLLVAAKLLEQKRKRTDVHAIAMGGHAGANKVEADPDEFMAVQPLYFQAMAYSMDVELFDRIDSHFQLVHSVLQKYMLPVQVNEENRIGIADWTMEITNRKFVENLTMLMPSVSRMHHIGVFGMGYDGNGQKHKEFPIPWKNWDHVVNDKNRTMDDFYLFPPELTDVYGFVCGPLDHATCSTKKAPDPFGYNKVRTRYSKGFFPQVDEMRRYNKSWKTIRPLPTDPPSTKLNTWLRETRTKLDWRWHLNPEFNPNGLPDSLVSPTSPGTSATRLSLVGSDSHSKRGVAPKAGKRLHNTLPRLPMQVPEIVTPEASDSIQVYSEGVWHPNALPMQ